MPSPAGTGLNERPVPAASGEDRVTVRAPARLHLGFLDLAGDLGRRFGSLGLTVEGLETHLRVERASTFTVEAEAEQDRARAMLERLAAAWSLPAVRVTVDRTIPAHAGLGSGTQLALALGTALARLSGRAVTSREIGALLQRGARSGIGIGAFDQGGFLLDGGRGADGGPPPVTARLDFPDDWRVLLIFDLEREGLHGSGEDRAFRDLPPYSPELAGRLCRLVVMQLLPGLVDADLGAVGQAIGEIQREVGDYFAPAQRGRFVSPAVSEVLAWLERQGVAGVGQSSWGPTGFALLPDAATAATMCREAEALFGRRFERLRFMVTRGRNRGADVRLG